MAAPAGVKSVAKWMASAVRGPPDLVAALPGYASAAETMWLDEDDMDLISVGTLQQQLCAGNGLRYLLHPTMFRPSARLAMGRNVIFLQTALFR